MRSYFDGMLRYFEFSGRSTRRQYWLFWLLSLILSVGAAFTDYYLFGRLLDPRHAGLLAAFAGIIHMIPLVTVTVRRLHDIGRSGWWYFIQLIPILGSLVLLYWMICPSEQWDNAYGPAPGEQPAGSWRPAPRSTIPRQIRMGSNSARPAHLFEHSEIQRFI